MPDVDRAQISLGDSHASRVALAQAALAAASDERAPYLERLRLLSELLPRALPPNTLALPENRDIAVAVTESAATAFSYPGFSGMQRDFAEVVNPTLLLAAALTLDDCSPQELVAVAQSCAHQDKRGKLMYGGLVDRTLALVGSASAQHLAEIFCAVPCSKADPEKLAQLAQIIIERAHELPSATLIRYAQALCLQSLNSPLLAQLLGDEILRRVHGEPFSTSCSLCDNFRSLCRQSAGHNHSSRPPSKYPELGAVYDSWLSQLEARSAEMLPRLVSSRERAKAAGANGIPGYTQRLSQLEQDFLAAPSTYSAKDCVAIVNACSRLPFRSRELHDAVSARLSAHVGSFSLEDLSSVVGAFGVLGYRDLSFLSRATNAAVPRFDEMLPREVFGLVVGLSELHELSPEVARLAVAHVNRAPERYSDCDRAQLLWRAAASSAEPGVAHRAREDFSSNLEPGAWTRTFQTLLLCGEFPKVDLKDPAIERRLKRFSTVPPSRLEMSVVSGLTASLRGVSVQIIPNPLVAGVEVDILVKTPRKQFIVEVDGDRFHQLYGPDGAALLFGSDVIQDKIFNRLNYTVFHICSSELKNYRSFRTVIEEISRKIRRGIDSEASLGTRSPAAEYPFSPVIPENKAPNLPPLGASQSKRPGRQS